MRVQVGLHRVLRFFLYGIYSLNGQSVIHNFEADVESGEGQTVDPVGLSLIGGPGIVGENTDGGIPLVLRQDGEQPGREIYL